jgi:formiminoglutamase
VGFPQDEGVRRNGGRTGAAAAPEQIRHFLYRLTPWDGRQDEDNPRPRDLGALRLLDLGNLVVDEDLEASQALLGRVVGAILRAGAVPIVLGGGHEEAFGHYLGYVEAKIPVAVLNLDAHLDVRPLIDGRGHSGSPFRQMMEHAAAPLPGKNYRCLGVQPFGTARQHLDYVGQHGGRIEWCSEVEGALAPCLLAKVKFWREQGQRTYLSIDADAVAAADVPGVSAPNPYGLSGKEVVECAFRAGQSPGVASLDLVEINPTFDVDGRSARWAAAAIWHFLSGLTCRRG